MNEKQSHTKGNLDDLHGALSTLETSMFDIQYMRIRLMRYLIIGSIALFLLIFCFCVRCL